MKYCPECGLALGAPTRFCVRCGARLAPAAPSPAAPALPAAPAVPAPAAPAVTELSPLRAAPRTGGLPSLIAMFVGLAVVSAALTYVVLQS